MAIRILYVNYLRGVGKCIYYMPISLINEYIFVLRS